VVSGQCELCAAGTWQDLWRVDAASQPCERCPRNASSVVTSAFDVMSCECATGFRLVNGSVSGGDITFMDEARACGLNANEACPALATGRSPVDQGAALPSFGNDNNFNTFF